MTDHHGEGGHLGDGTEGIHGMVLFGEETRYLSHLPMFGPPHHFQVILEVEFDDTVSSLLRDDGEEMHTFEPLKFHLTELDPSGDGPARTSMEGTVYRGHFERGGQKLTGLVTAEVRNVVYFAELDVQAHHDADRALTYLCFGRAGQLHLAHEITASPDFDQVLDARLVPGTVTDPAGRRVDSDLPRDFDRAAPVQFRGRNDVADDRMLPDETGDGFFFATVGPTGSHGFGVQVAIGRERYMELGDLGS